MAYSTIAQVEVAVGGSRNLIELSDLEEGAAVDDDVVNAAIRTADGRINSYLSQRYSTPLAIVPDTVSDISAAWAARVLRRNRYKGAPMDGDQADEKTDIAWLEKVAKGEIRLGVDPEPAKAGIIVDKAAPRDSTLSVSRERMKGFI